MNDENKNVLPSIGQISISTPLVAPAENISGSVTRTPEDAVGETRQVTDDQPVQPQRFDASAAENVLSSLWRSPGQTHLLGTRDKQSGRFQNQTAPGISEAVAFAQASSALGLDAYFACAEYASAGNRTAQNAAGAWGFWCDIDCGSDKGYASVGEAEASVRKFCTEACLPEPTHIVISGSGIHAYWAVDVFLARDLWLTSASKLKALMKAKGLHADPSRTADIASVMRVPGTLNYKYQPPKPVTMLSSTDECIPLTDMVSAIDAAVTACGAETDKQASIDEPAPAVPLPTTNASVSEPPNLLRLESALKSLDPDCDEYSWKFHRLAPLANLAREFPELTDTLRDLAVRWSSGELRGAPSLKWKTPGGNGLTGSKAFGYVWKWLLTNNYKGTLARVGTIFHHAIEAGWTYEPGQAESADFEDVSAL